jgi:hypothetical protein
MNRFILFVAAILGIFSNIFAQQPWEKSYNERWFPNHFVEQSPSKTTNTLQDSNVTLIGKWPNGSCYTSFVVGNYAYIGNGAAMDILDITNPSDPVRVGQVITPCIVMKIYVSGNYAYVANYEEGLRIIDVSTPSAPLEVGFFEGEGGFLEGGTLTWSVYVSSNYAYVADWEAGLRIIDISNPSMPVQVGLFDTKNWAVGIYVSGSYAYVADGSDGLRIIDISNPSTPVEVGFFDTEGTAESVYVSGNYAYVGDWSEGLRIIDISKPFITC